MTPLFEIRLAARNLLARLLEETCLDRQADRSQTSTCISYHREIGLAAKMSFGLADRFPAFARVPMLHESCTEPSHSLVCLA